MSGRVLESFRRIFERRYDSTFAVPSQRPALIGETIETIVTENEVIEEPDTQ
mgnify:CR=1 FL=1